MKIRTLVITFALLCLVDCISIAYIIGNDMDDAGYKAFRNAVTMCLIMIIDIEFLTIFNGVPKGPLKDVYFGNAKHNIFVGAIVTAILTMVGWGLTIFDAGVLFINIEYMLLMYIEYIAACTLTVIICLNWLYEHQLYGQIIEND